jgi:MGT family glycosyltransferase
MSRFLFATVPAVGHTAPALPIAKVLIDRGHSVRWYTGMAFRDQITSIGATYCSMSGHDSSVVGRDGHFPERSELSGLRRLQHDLVHGFVRPAAAQVRDLRHLLAAEPADVIVGDTGFLGGPLVQELGGPPFAAYGITVAAFPSPDQAPFGLGLRPTNGPLGRLRNRALDRFVRATLFKPVIGALNEIRRELGLPESSKSLFEYPMRSAVYLQLSPESFEYPRSDLPDSIRYVGPPRPLPDTGWQPPAWWSDLEGARRVVLVNQGTVATDSEQLLRPALTALADEDCLVVAVTGGPDPAVLGPLPGNARVERRIPFDQLMPHVDVFVTNGGYGGVQLALAHGVPMVAAGKTEDKSEVTTRIAFSGVGINLRTQTPTPDQVRTAVREVLADPSYAEAAGWMKLEIEVAGREEAAASLLEEVARTGRVSASAETGKPV